MKRLLSILAVLAVFGLAISVYQPVAASDKVTVCHLQDKDDTTGHLIDVSTSSLPAHCAHGDRTVDIGADPCTVTVPCAQ